MNCLVCGRNDDTQLGVNDSNYQGKCRKQNCKPSPLNLNIDKSVIIIDAACGSRHSLFLTRQGKVMACGWNEHHQCGPCNDSVVTRPVPIETNDISFIQVAASYACSYGLSSEGNIYSWGKGTNGMLGYDRGQSKNSQGVPSQIYIPHQRIKIVSAGYQHCLALTENQHLFSWGRNENGQLGLGIDIKYVGKPSQVTFGSTTMQLTSISAGHHHSLALSNSMNLREDGFKEKCCSTVYTWGRIERLGKVRDKTRYSTPQEDLSISKKLQKMIQRKQNEGQTNHNICLTQVAAGGHHSLALTSCGQVVAWGSGSYGQLGNGKVYDLPFHPCIVQQARNVIKVEASTRSSYAISKIKKGNQESFQLFSWGYNCNGELGLDNQELKLQPYPINLVDDCIKIASDYHHSIIITGSGLSSL